MQTYSLTEKTIQMSAGMTLITKEMMKMMKMNQMMMIELKIMKKETTIKILRLLILIKSLSSLITKGSSTCKWL